MDDLADSYSLEAAMKHLLWNKVEQDGYEGQYARGFSEVSFFNNKTGISGRFDLVAQLYETDYLIGFEFKARFPAHEGESQGLLQYFYQLQKYVDSNYLNELFLVAPTADASKFDDYLKTTQHMKVIDDKLGGAYFNIKDFSIPESFGIMAIKIDSPSTTLIPEPVIVRPAEAMKRSSALKLPRNEAWYGHILWKELISRYENCVIPEAKLPSGDRLDFIVLNDSGMLGFEVKDTLDEQIYEQLKRYQEANYVDKLYLVVPNALKEKARVLVHNIGVEVTSVDKSNHSINEFN